MNTLKRFFSLLMSAIMMLLALNIPCALAADDPSTVVLNVTNTPVRGQVALEKTGLQLVRFVDEVDAYGNTIMKPVY